GRQLGDYLNESSFTNYDANPIIQSQGLTDINGDGLVDHWVYAGSPAVTSVTFNDGLAFSNTAATAMTLNVRPSADAVLSYASCQPPCTFVAMGTHADTSRLLDVDQDGRPDVVQAQGTNGSTTFFNQGGQFCDGTQNCPAAGLLTDITANAHLIAAD